MKKNTVNRSGSWENKGSSDLDWLKKHGAYIYPFPSKER